MRRRSLLSCALVALGLFAYSSQARAALIDHWAFEEGAGTTTADSAIGGHTGTLVGGMGNANWVPGAPLAGGSNFALAFDGTDDAVQIAGYTAPDASMQNPRSIAAWISTSQPEDPAVLSWGENNNGQKWVVRINDNAGNGQVGALRLEVNGGFQIGSTVINDGVWRHVAVTWENDGSPNVQDAVLYVDGVQEAISGNQTNNINTNPVHIVELGRDSHAGNNRRWLGRLDDVRIYDHVLTAGEVSALAARDATASTLPLPAIEWDASNDPTPGDATWEETGSVRPSLNLSLDPSVAFNPNPMSGAENINGAYTFDGSGGGMQNNIESGFPGNITIESVSIEVLFKPANLMGQKVIAEFGGQTDGSSFTLDDDVLQFTSKDNNNFGGVSVALGGVPDEFVHAVAVIDLAGDTVSLYVNGAIVGQDGFVGADWAGANPLGIGVRGSAETGGSGGTFGGLNGYGGFMGDITTVAIYRQTLDDAQIAQLFDERLRGAPVPEPATATLALLSLGGLMLRRRRRTA